MDKTYKDFLTWCYNVGNKPSSYTALKEFVDGVKNDTLVKCSVCENYEHEQHMHSEVCETCYNDKGRY